ncbi:MAG: hypothetical protein A2087_09275 [Spirochaetes bacterium GWD1_61_31]|nr:MAG: hypothetical protein A2Y37_07495 [Spirochaetes bacterium GWB1_60_80]OHD34668.1 MAG: hypothetical protein A2004_01335 [Spirochaetes bacterium GWC1_61_12]OHD36048.1 MAG: hypothetical protein A2087_09275 [Spirochaetes bacterium GWD1_61_31]OHD42435.1 MAG: hypothetical protein A2Y35_06285 [Spirochaetes bacterium GWE1_60_18]OHD59237.1 MAG: hypothetical protein A2Y32_00465 [Spirochaetes bacterium GWF1_60_12]
MSQNINRCEAISLAGVAALRLAAPDGASAIIVPALGGMVHQVSLPAPDGRLHRLLRTAESGQLPANPAYAGAFMLPFAGRVRGGRYPWSGRQHQLPVDGTGNALHGCLAGQPLAELGRELAADQASLSLGWQLEPDRLPGYPFSLGWQADYRLDRQGFSITLTVTNRGPKAAPISCGWHPYFRLDEPLDSWRLHYPASHYIPIAPDFFPSAGPTPVNGSGWDFRAAPTLGGRQLDGPLCAVDGQPVRLSAPAAGYAIELRADRLFGFIQLYTPPLRDAIAIEPVSAPSGAFNGEAPGLITLAPGESRGGGISLRLSSA